MAHQIETHGDQAAAIFAREDAWHKLGTTLPGAFTAEEAMTIGHLGGWNVRKVQATATEMTDDGVTTVEIPDKFAILRTNPFTNATEGLGVVGKAYTPIQNEEHAAMLNALVQESGAIFDTAGSLKGGREVFITMKMPEGITVGGVDRVDLNIAALNSHDGTSAIKICLGPVRVVCANTQTAMLQNHESMFVIRHTTNAARMVDEARRSLGLAVEYFAAFEQEAERMIQTQMTDDAFRQMLADNFGAPDDSSDRVKANATAELEALEALWNNSPTNTEIRGTRWAAYQAITEYVDHFIPVRGAKGSDEATVRAERVLTAPDLGAIKRDAFELLRVPA